MALTNAQHKKIWLISDTILYPAAKDLVHRVSADERVKQLPNTSQVMGFFDIVETATTYSALTNYIKHQIKREVDLVFYEQIEQELKNTENKRLQADFQLLSPHLTGKIANLEKDELMLAIAREFIRHIIAEHGIVKLREKEKKQ